MPIPRTPPRGLHRPRRPPGSWSRRDPLGRPPGVVLRGEVEGPADAGTMVTVLPGASSRPDPTSTSSTGTGSAVDLGDRRAGTGMAAASAGAASGGCSAYRGRRGLGRELSRRPARRWRRGTGQLDRRSDFHSRRGGGPERQIAGRGRRCLARSHGRLVGRGLGASVEHAPRTVVTEASATSRFKTHETSELTEPSVENRTGEPPCSTRYST